MNMKFQTMEEKAEFYAKNCHRSTNHMYGDEPYEFHLKQVRDVCFEFRYLLNEDQWDYAFASAWCHDTIEDTRQTWNDVKENVNEYVADVSLLLQTPKGKTRKERHSTEYYAAISENSIATFVKIADRIANMRNGLRAGNSMVIKYGKEMPHFIEQLESTIAKCGFEPMCDELNHLRAEALKVRIA